MDALILSCGTGGGHNSAGRAVECELVSRGHRVTFLDPYTLKDQKTSSVVNHAYISLAQKAPWAFGAVYKLGDAYRKLPVRSPVYHINRGMAPILAGWLEEHPCDAIIMPHLFPAEIVTQMKKQGLPVPATFFVATDYCCIPFTEETDCDRYIIPSPDLTEDFRSRGVPAEKLAPLGIPVRPAFMRQRDREGARRRLGLESGGVYVLVAGGSIGAGSLEETVGTILESFDRVHVIVVCGNNRTLYESLRQKYVSRCTGLDDTPCFADYMHACDLFISKPGGLSSTEAAVLGTALIHVTPIPGCETINMEFFSSRGMSLPVTSPREQLADACARLLSGDAQARMVDCQRASIPRDAAVKIGDLIEKTVAER